MDYSSSTYDDAWYRAGGIGREYAVRLVRPGEPAPDMAVTAPQPSAAPVKNGK